VGTDIADEGVQSQVLPEGLVEIVLEGDVSVEEALECGLAEGGRLGLVGEEVLLEFGEDGLHYGGVVGDLSAHGEMYDLSSNNILSSLKDIIAVPVIFLWGNDQRGRGTCGNSGILV
jgi:hypothetical protein